MSKVLVGEAVSVRAQNIIETLGMVGMTVPICEAKGSNGNVTVRSIKAYLAGLEIGQDTTIRDPIDGFNVVGYNHTGFTPEQVFEFTKSIDPYAEFPAAGGGEKPLKVQAIPELIKQLARGYAHYVLTGGYWTVMDEWDGKNVPANSVMLRRDGIGAPRQIEAFVHENRKCYVRELEINKGDGKWFWHKVAARVRGKLPKNVIALTKFHFLGSLLKQGDGTSNYTGIRVVGGRWGQWFREALLSEVWRLSGLNYSELPRAIHRYGKV